VNQIVLTETILNLVYVNGFRFSSVTVIDIAHIADTFTIVEKVITSEYHIHTGAFGVSRNRTNVAADATKHNEKEICGMFRCESGSWQSIYILQHI